MRISRYSKCSNVCGVMAYSYLQRLAKKDRRFMLCPRNIHRMYLAGVMLAAKLMDDNVFNNPYWAKIGGISTEELHELELFALKQLDYRLIISSDEVATRLRELKVLAHSRAAAPGEAGLFLPAPQQPALMA
ncbi:hypothetical protein CVIRNUC_003751 [Coccomyxa viridis]|uniref:Cyclin n=1 Tax=Coccomyxa viridis TaxID=1274662 RepID=A0AAV1I110_9CHLO|nr:hypothetical protein CVIRNUC_003751 [Coccomyxa viridis]